VAVEQQLGAQLVSRSLKLADVVRKWDHEGSGAISRAQFERHVRDIGVKGASAAEVTQLFERYSEGRSELAVEKQLKPMVKRLISMGTERLDLIKELEKTRTRLCKTATRQQHALAVARTQEAEEAKAAEAQAARVVAEAQAAEAEAKQQAKERRAAAMKAKAAEKESFNAKIAARRAAANPIGGLGKRSGGAPLARGERAAHRPAAIAV